MVLDCLAGITVCVRFTYVQGYMFFIPFIWTYGPLGVLVRCSNNSSICKVVCDVVKVSVQEHCGRGLEGGGIEARVSVRMRVNMCEGGGGGAFGNELADGVNNRSLSCTDVVFGCSPDLLDAE